MQSAQINFSPCPTKYSKKNKMMKDKKGHQEDRKIPEIKQFLKDPKRSVVANIGKSGIIIEQPYWIYDEGHDVTPKMIEDSLFPNSVHHESLKKSPIYQCSKLGRSLMTVSSQRSFISSVHSDMRKLSSVGSKMTFMQSKISEFSLESTHKHSFTSENLLTEELKDEELVIDIDSRAPSMFRLRIDPPSRNIQSQTTYTVHLTETNTIFMLEIPSTAEFLESEEGKLICESNSLYEKRQQTTKPVSQVAIQTDNIFSKNRKLYIPRNKRANASTFATTWLIYDTYQNMKNLSLFSFSLCDVGKLIVVETETGVYNMEFNYLGNVFSNRLLEALMIMERLIINDLYKENHLIFNGLLVQDPLSLEVIYSYSLKHLWTFYSEKVVRKRTVTSISWNKADPNIFAVGYGKMYYKDHCNGSVCIWNVKNPLYPERHYEFEHPVTFVTFNPIRKQILAVTFYNGSVFLIDIISRVLLIKASNSHYPLFYPVWQARWFLTENNRINLVTCGKNGKIYRYKKDKFFTSRKIMTIGKVHGKIQGVEQPKPCYAKKTLTLSSPSAEVLVRHPSDPMVYLVGTSDGCIFRCSIMHLYDYQGVIQAHTGPVYNIQFNPFCNKVFLTCGMDWCIRIWVEGVYVPLITLHSGTEPVQDARWSPLHSTVVLSVIGTQVQVWDLRRRISAPMSSINTPSGSFNTQLYFTINGYNVCVGDLEGNVHLFAMAEMPFSPMYQEDVLVQALKSALASQPDLLLKLVKLGKPFSSSKSSRTKTRY